MISSFFVIIINHCQVIELSAAFCLQVPFLSEDPIVTLLVQRIFRVFRSYSLLRTPTFDSGRSLNDDSRMKLFGCFVVISDRSPSVMGPAFGTLESITFNCLV